MSSLKLYTRNKNPVRTLSSGIDYKDLQIIYDHTAPDETMSFTILGPKVPEDIEPEGYIETESQIYVIKEISDHQITAQLCLEELEAYTLDTFTAVDQTITAAASAALKGTGWTAESSISRVRSVQTFKKQPLEVIKKIRDAWMCEMQFDTKNRTVIFGETIGKDRGTYFIRGVNLKEVSESRDSYDFYTRIQPIGKDGLTITEVNNGSEYIENHQYSEKNRTLVWEDTSYEDPQALMEDAEKKLADMSQPKKSYKASVKDLSRIHQETDDEPLQDELDVVLKDEISELLYDRSIYADFDFSPGDMVYIVSRTDGIRDKQRVVKMTIYPDEPERNEIELANTVLTFEELQSKMQAAADAWEDVSDSDGTINGVYVHGIQADAVTLDVHVGVEAELPPGVAHPGGDGDLEPQVNLAAPLSDVAETGGHDSGLEHVIGHHLTGLVIPDSLHYEDIPARGVIPHDNGVAAELAVLQLGDPVRHRQIEAGPDVLPLEPPRLGGTAAGEEHCRAHGGCAAESMTTMSESMASSQSSDRNRSSRPLTLSSIPASLPGSGRGRTARTAAATTSATATASPKRPFRSTKPPPLSPFPSPTPSIS